MEALVMEGSAAGASMAVDAGKLGFPRGFDGRPLFAWADGRQLRTLEKDRGSAKSAFPRR